VQLWLSGIANKRVRLSLLPPEIVMLFCLVHFAIVVASIATEGSGATAQLAEFNNVFDPSGDPQKAFAKMVTFPNFVGAGINCICDVC
jgi:hypothetical protein